MSQIYGADVAQLRLLATRFTGAADQLDQCRANIGSQLQSVNWLGSDANRFKSGWHNYSRQLHDTSCRLRDAAQVLRGNAEEQERASVVGGSTAGQDGLASILRGIEVGVQRVIDVSSIAGTINDIVETTLGSGRDVISNLPGGKYLAAGLKGIGLGDALVGVAEGVRDRDYSGAMSSGADGVFTFAAAPVSLLWTGLKAETEFFIPLDQASQDEHMSWMEERYTPEQISERYSGVQGFINLGNDNVERKAPWMNDIADKVMQKPAEWLYNAGIKLI